MFGIAKPSAYIDYRLIECCALFRVTKVKLALKVQFRWVAVGENPRMLQLTHGWSSSRSTALPFIQFAIRAEAEWASIQEAT